MAELTLMKTATGALVPVDQETAEALQKLKVGQGLKGKFTKQNNLLLHRKLFSLFTLAFDVWEPEVQEYKGQIIAKEFDRFRKDLTILAGHYEMTMRLNGDVRVEAKSLNFASMDDDEKQKVFRSVLDAVWKHVLKDAGYLSPEQVHEVVENLLRYD